MNGSSSRRFPNGVARDLTVFMTRHLCKKRAVKLN